MTMKDWTKISYDISTYPPDDVDVEVVRAAARAAVRCAAIGAVTPAGAGSGLHATGTIATQTGAP